MMGRYFAALILLAGLGTAHASNVLLTGHDVLFHDGQHGFDGVALDFIRGAGHSNEIAREDFNIAVIGTQGVGGGRFTGSGQTLPNLAHGATIPATGTLADYGTAVFWNAESIGASDFATVDAIVILSHTSCGGCSLTNNGVNALIALSGAIADAFNDGMRIWANSGASSTTYYDFLPPGAVATAAAISGSTGFDCTAAGAEIGLTGGPSCPPATPSMINTHPTHNRFTAFSDVFTVYEVHTTNGWDITIGAQGLSIADDAFVPTPPTPSPVPTPGPLGLIAGLLVGMSMFRRRYARPQ
jgi:hypothetical protein